MKEANKIIKGRKIVLPIVILLLLPFCLCTCMDDDETNKKDEVSNHPELAEAINYMKGKKLSMLNLEKTFGNSTRSIQEGESDNTGLTPDWNTLRTIKKENCEIQLFLLKSEVTIAGFVQTRISGKIKEELSTATLKLALWKIDGKLEGRIITYIPNRKFIRNPENDVKELGYPLDGSCFSGICLVSTLDGVYQFGECYNEGVCLFNFFPHKPQKKELVLDQIYKEEEKLASTHIFFNLIPEKTTQTRATYSTNEENIDGICPFCYKNYGNCACNVVIIAPQTRCENCFLPRDYCICCSKCHRYPCICSGGGGTTGGGGSVGGGGSIGGGNLDDTDPPSISDINKKKLGEILPTLKIELQKLGAKTEGITFKYTDMCISNCEVPPNEKEINVCPNFFKFYTIFDQISILWHECLHLEKGHIIVYPCYKYDDDLYERIPLALKARFDEMIRWRVSIKYPNATNLEQLREWERGDFTIIYDIRSPRKYQNEIDVYEAEIGNVGNVSQYYETERMFMLWKYIQLLELSKKYYKY